MQYKNIRLRKIKLKDISYICDYWYRADESYWEERSIDSTKFSSEENFKLSLHGHISDSIEEKKLLILCYKKLAIGFFVLTDIFPGATGILHAHIWEEKLRGKGIMTVAYPMACLEFCKQLELHKILFETPVANIPANRIKEKLGIKPIKQVVARNKLLKPNTIASYYELERTSAEKMIVNHVNYFNKVQ